MRIYTFKTELSSFVDGDPQLGYTESYLRYGKDFMYVLHHPEASLVIRLSEAAISDYYAGKDYYVTVYPNIGYPIELPLRRLVELYHRSWVTDDELLYKAKEYLNVSTY